MYMFTSLMLLVLVGAGCVGVVLFIVLAKCLITVVCIYIHLKNTFAVKKDVSKKLQVPVIQCN